MTESDLAQWLVESGAYFPLNNPDVIGMKVYTSLQGTCERYCSREAYVMALQQSKPVRKMDKSK